MWWSPATLQDTGPSAVPCLPGHHGHFRPNQTRPGPGLMDLSSFSFPSNSTAPGSKVRRKFATSRISFKSQFWVKNSCAFCILSHGKFMFILMCNVFQYLPISKTDMPRGCATLYWFFQAQGLAAPEWEPASLSLCSSHPQTPQAGILQGEKIPTTKSRVFTT